MLKQIIETLTKQQKVDLYARDISPQTISYWKNGKRKPTFAQCVSLAAITGNSLDKLLIEVALSEARPEDKEKFEHLLTEAAN